MLKWTHGKLFGKNSRTRGNLAEDARHELEQLARDIEAEIGKGVYRATPYELAGIDRGLRDSADGKFAAEADVEKTLGKLRQ